MSEPLVGITGLRKSFPTGDGTIEVLRGIDLVIDSAGGDGLHDSLDTLRACGRYVFFGATRGNAEQGVNMAKLFFRQIRIQGTTMGRPQEFRDMLDFVNLHGIEPVLDEVVPFEQAVAAHQRMLDAEQMGKIVLEIA